MKRICVLMLCCVLMGAAIAVAQDQGSIVAPSDQKFGPVPNFPSCVKAAVLHGDPSKSSGVVVLAKGTAGCVIPWHWHTANEQLGVVSGTTKLAMKGSAAKTLTAGSYAYMPAKHTHEFTCVSACSLFVAADNVFDIHYVDKDDKEITLDQATGKGAKAAAPTKSAAKPATPKK